MLNNGAGIPVEVHKTEGIYVPELIFGNLLTSSNYNDNEKKVGGWMVAGVWFSPCRTATKAQERSAVQCSAAGWLAVHQQEWAHSNTVHPQRAHPHLRR